MFLAVLRAGSTLAASRELGQAQPTVARRIEALEQALGLTLFERDTRGFQPTDEALGLKPAAEEIEAAISNFSNRVQRLKTEKARVIRIAATTATFTKNFSAILAEFSNEHHDVRFEFMPGENIVDLSAGEADVALRMANKIDDQSLICRKIVDIEATCYASRSYAERTALPASENDLQGHSFVVYEGENVPRLINDWLLARIMPDQIAMTCSDVRSMTAAVQMGVGIGPLPATIADKEESLVRCFDPPEGTSVPSWLLISPAAYRRPEIKAFTAFFAPRFAALFRRA